MIQTKIKCEGEGAHYSFQAREVTIEEAISKGWWEISVQPTGLQWGQPKMKDSFHGDSHHVCCASCARDFISRYVAAELSDEVEEKNAEDIPY